MGEAINDSPLALPERFENWEDWDTKLPFWKHAVAGCCAGVSEHLAVFPMDTIKTHMQALRPFGAEVTLLRTAHNIWYHEGLLGFMSGASAVMGGCIPAHAAMFISYEFMKSRLLDADHHQPMKAAVCGACATFFHDIILNPMDLVKQRMQLGVHSSVTECFHTVTRQEGAIALYRSMPTTIAMNLPYGSALVAVNESAKLFFVCGQTIWTNCTTLILSLCRCKWCMCVSAYTTF